MPTPQILNGLSEVADRYDVLLCDVWGVIHNGAESFPEACAGPGRSAAPTHGPVILISNSPRPAAAVVEQLRPPGRAARGLERLRHLGRRHPRPAGRPRARPGLDRSVPTATRRSMRAWAWTSAGPDDAAFVCRHRPGRRRERGARADYARPLRAAAAERGLTLICANPDRVVQRGDKLIYCGGALADLYETLGGQVLMAGKPYAPIYDLRPWPRPKRCRAARSTAARVLCIGDGVPTDVKGAHDRGPGLPVHRHGHPRRGRLDAEGRLLPDAVATLLEHEGTRPLCGDGAGLVIIPAMDKPARLWNGAKP